MNSRNKNARTWSDLHRALGSNDAGVTARIPKAAIPHPRDAGARTASTWPVGQVADYAFDGGQGEAPLLVREFEDRFEAFLDGVRVTGAALNAAQRSPTAAMYMGGALLGGAIGSSVSNKREGALLGAGMGLLFAALLDSALNESRRSPTRRGGT